MHGVNHIINQCCVDEQIQAMLFDYVNITVSSLQWLFA